MLFISHLTHKVVSIFCYLSQVMLCVVVVFFIPQTYAGQLKSVEVQYGRVMSFGEELVGNPHVGGGVAIKQEIEELRMKFEPLKDNVVDSLELLKRSE